MARGTKEGKRKEKERRKKRRTNKESGSFLWYMYVASIADGRSACRPVWLALAVTTNTYVGSLKFIDATAWHVVSLILSEHTPAFVA